MTDDGFARRLPELMDELGRGDDRYIEEVLGLTARMAQRPAWTFVARWLALADTKARTPGLQTRFVALLVLLTVLALLGAAAAWVGSRHQAEPLTTHPSNGWIAYSTDGQHPGATDTTTGSDLYLVREGGLPILVAGRDGGTTRNVCPSFSPDGRHLAFGVASNQGRAVVVLGIDADGVSGETERIAVPGSGLPRSWAAPGPLLGMPPD